MAGECSVPASDSAAVHAALASESRRGVMGALAAAATPLDAGALAAVLEMHVTTVRFHLEQLEEAGLVMRAEAPDDAPRDASRRGRPRVYFSVVDVTREVGREERSREQLIEVLAAALAGQGAAEAARTAERAGGEWARALANAAAGGQVNAAGVKANAAGIKVNAAGAEEHGGADAALERVLAELGFEPERAGDEIQLRACPFREAARQYPEVVCSVHRGLVNEMLSAEQRARGVRLLPFVQPEVCAIGVPAP